MGASAPDTQFRFVKSLSSAARSIFFFNCDDSNFRALLLASTMQNVGGGHCVSMETANMRMYVNIIIEKSSLCH